MISLIVAASKNCVIGKDGKIPWRLPEDLKRFKALTMGHVLIMGRKTYESIGRPLPGRRTLVLTRSRSWVPPVGDLSQLPRESKGHGTYLQIERSLSRAIVEAIDSATIAQTSREIFICGGVEVYREVLERDVVDKVYLTKIDADFEGDTFFPFVHELFSEPHWQLMKETEWLGSWSTPETFPHRYWFREYDRMRR